ncbi:rRNA/tRNA 2'-O-methyltransferase fibrillarin-like protein 1 [Spodoptera litura]|uniref:rRNA/tRNA 2'-O-methyltransferase fibrillarin-like protein 1 n=1 Tax=Spodoptera litura TaxID=69820 RepID=A0A9J7J2R1_SPOLT|nr:rRNA/tRNA 2'-O-methyltransferase fibrillarin-like protein 1 [Spodoptera litura]
MLPGEVPLPLPVQNEIPVVNTRPRRNQGNRRTNHRIIVRLPLRTGGGGGSGGGGSGGGGGGGGEAAAAAQPAWVEDAPPAESPRETQPRSNENDGEFIHRRTGNELVTMHVSVPSRLVASISGGVLN